MPDTKNKTLNIYLGDLKPKWIAYCKSKNVKPGVLLKRAVESELRKSGDNQDRVGEKPETVEPTKKPIKKLQAFLITESEKKAALKAAKKSGTTLRGWIVDTIRGGLTRDPQFTMDEIVALGESNYQLKMIGINLNQIAKKLNEDSRYIPELEILSDLTREININIDTSSTLIRSCVERWDIK